MQPAGNVRDLLHQCRVCIHSQADGEDLNFGGSGEVGLCNYRRFRLGGGSRNVLSRARA